MLKYYSIAEKVAKSHFSERERSVRVLIWLREGSPLVIRKERPWGRGFKSFCPPLIRLRRVFALRCNEEVYLYTSNFGWYHDCSSRDVFCNKSTSRFFLAFPGVGRGTTKWWMMRSHRNGVAHREDASTNPIFKFLKVRKLFSKSFCKSIHRKEKIK